MRYLLHSICIFFLLFSIGCSNIDKRNTVNVKPGLESIIYNSIIEYSRYMTYDVNKFGGDKNYTILALTSQSSDTVSYMMICNESNDLSSIIMKKLTTVHKIDNHFIFSKSQLFSNYSKIDFDKVALRIDKESYKTYKQKGKEPDLKTIWKCPFMYLVVKDNKILRKEIRFANYGYSTKPKMWKNNF